MSLQAMRLVWEHSRSTGVTRLVLLAMADSADAEGVVASFPRSQSHFAAKAAVSVSTVRRAIERLDAMGELVVLTKGDGRRSASYRLTLTEDTQGAHTEQAGGAERTPTPVTENTQGVQPAPPIIPVLPESPHPLPRAIIDEAAALHADDACASMPAGHVRDPVAWKQAAAEKWTTGNAAAIERALASCSTADDLRRAIDHPRRAPKEFAGEVPRALTDEQRAASRRAKDEAMNALRRKQPA